MTRRVRRRSVSRSWFAIIIAAVFLHERFTPIRIAAVLLAACAVPLLRLG